MNVKSQKCVGGASEHTAKHTTLPEDLLPDILSFVVNCYAEPSFCWVDDPCDWLNPQYGHYHYWCGFCALKVENDRNEKRLFDAGCEDCDALRTLRTVSKKFQSMTEVVTPARRCAWFQHAAGCEPCSVTPASHRKAASLSAYCRL